MSKTFRVATAATAMYLMSLTVVPWALNAMHPNTCGKWQLEWLTIGQPDRYLAIEVNVEKRELIYDYLSDTRAELGVSSPRCVLRRHLKLPLEKALGYSLDYGLESAKAIKLNQSVKDILIGNRIASWVEPRSLNFLSLGYKKDHEVLIIDEEGVSVWNAFFHRNFDEQASNEVLHGVPAQWQPVMRVLSLIAMDIRRENFSQCDSEFQKILRGYLKRTGKHRIAETDLRVVAKEWVRKGCPGVSLRRLQDVLARRKKWVKRHEGMLEPAKMDQLLNQSFTSLQ